MEDPRDTLSPETKAALNRIVDVISGADGGVDFVMLLARLRTWDRDQDKDPAAYELIKRFRQFAKLVDLMSKPIQEQKT